MFTEHPGNLQEKRYITTPDMLCIVFAAKGIENQIRKLDLTATSGSYQIAASILRKKNIII